MTIVEMVLLFPNVKNFGSLVKHIESHVVSLMHFKSSLTLLTRN